ncbi:pentapeptide repeat-containing protein [Micromonospora sp. C28ISP2-4]|uniref:pentapeptide repeat-containing protein n=1 Tax=Micromonospora sp. C28ISP2-4 TaxID=3059523 RepID=UPI0026772194|nr:pentapeptide repeat-containing protein [Micromonospora sp. C28ISP2-4]MDO3685948.1 pentapeptide repeat-containing protein [Micromonospora sp. C28ISP2-4]
MSGRWRSQREQADTELRQLPWRLSAALVLGVVLGGGLLALWLLEDWASRQGGMSPAAEAKLRLEAIRTALTVAAGLGAGVTLLVALRRQSISERSQQHIERSQRFAEEDAREQRITALYVAAAEQLGSDKAAVRLAGLYALERLGQDNPKLRQTVVEVWCAYLRMPYIPPLRVLERNEQSSPQYAPSSAEVPEPVEEQGRREELQVRLTAQRLITNHLSVPNETDFSASITYWRGATGERMSLDLVGATLVGFDLSSCHVDQINLGGAQLHGYTNLTGAQFHGQARLNRAQFYGYAIFKEVQFHDTAGLREAQFYGGVDLEGAQFHEYAALGGAQAHKEANLHGAQFFGETRLSVMQFHGNVDLGATEFRGYVDARATQFHGDVNLRFAKFRARLGLHSAHFYGYLSMRGAQFQHPLNMSDVWATSVAELPPGWTLGSERGPTGLLRVVAVVVDDTGQSDDQRMASGDDVHIQDPP